MADTATSRGRLRKQTLASNVNIWGDPYLNTNFDLLDQQIDGVTTIALGTSTATTLTSTNYGTDQQRNKVWVFTGTGTQTCTASVPQVEQVKLVVNKSAGAVVITPAAGTSVTVAAGERALIYNDGTNFDRGDPTLDKVRAPTAAVSLNSQRIISLADPSSAQDAATKAYVDQSMIAGAATAAFLTLSTSAALSNERVLTPAANELYLTTGTAGGVAAIGLATDTVAFGTRALTGGTWAALQVAGTATASALTVSGTATSAGLVVTSAVTLPSASVATAALASTPLRALGSVTPAADALPYFTGTASAGTTALTTFARTLLTGTDAAAMRSTLVALATNGDASAATVIATGGTASLPLSEVSGSRVDVRHFGAVGDGVADDTAALQAAINAMNAEGWRRYLYLPGLSGIGYRITSPLLLTADRSRLVGDRSAMSAILLDNADATMPAIKIGYQASQINGVSLTDLTFTRAQAGASSVAVDCKLTGATEFTRVRIYGDSKFAVGFSLLSGSLHTFNDCSAENCTATGYKLRGASGAGYKLIDTFFYGCRASSCATGHDWGDYVEGVFWDILYVFNSTTALLAHGTSSGTGPTVMKGALLELDTCTTAADLDYAYNLQAADMWMSNVTTTGLKLGRVDTIHVRIGTGYVNSGATLVDIGNGTDAAKNVVLASVNAGAGAIGIRVRANTSGVVIGPHRLRGYTTAAIQIDGGDHVTVEPGSYYGNTANITGASAATNSLILETVTGGVRINGGTTLLANGGAAQLLVGSDLLVEAFRGSGSAGDTKFTLRPEGTATRLANDGAASNIAWQLFAKGSGAFVWGQQGGLDNQITAYRGSGVSGDGGVEARAESGGYRLQSTASGANGFFQIFAKGSGTLTLGLSTNTLAFYGATGSTKQTVTGSRGSNAALASLITALANLGLITDSTT